MGQILAGCAASAAPPKAAPATSPAEIAGIVRDEIAKAHLPGAVVLLSVGDRVVLRQAFGERSLQPSRRPATLDTIYDAASLTKVMATAVAIQQLAERGAIELDKPAMAYWPEFAANGKAAITVLQLLTHYAGLPPGISTGGWSGREGALATIAALKPPAPAGAHFTYSDVDFIVLGEVVRRVSGEPLEAYAARHIFEPLGMRDTSYLPASALRERIAPADYEPGGLRWGEVQDPIAHRMGGVAGHAGVFTTVDDLARFARMMLGEATPGGTPVLSPRAIAAMTRPQSPEGGGSLRGLGWDIDSPYAGFLAPHFQVGSFGHTGYTGTALWLDPATRSYLIVLSNRLHPDGKGNVLPLLRRVSAVSGRIARQVAHPATATRPVQTGIEVLKQEAFRQVIGRRLGLITNRAARDATGRRTADVLKTAPGVHLVALFSPEHGLEASGEGRIGSTRDAATGLPVHSLYGDARRPTDAMLAGIDALVFDMQDAGTRYYTYPTTMAYAMEEASRRRLDFFVLDRPNPVTADTVQGPMLDPDLVSFITYLPLPARHGMTLGELARYFKGEKPIDVRLNILGMRGYERGQWFDQTGLVWTPPSPNLRTVGQTVLYPAVGMVEGANVSVGRGTDAPFEVLGAPWIDGRQLAAALTGRGIAGVRFEAVSFTPTASAYARETCQGVRLTVTDRDRLDAPLLGIELIAALQRLHADRFAIDRTLGLVGSRASLEALKAGVDPRGVRAAWEPALDAFRSTREKYLLY
jgi:uncharacterized protein YbbC (DUF1343 family)